jgi:hypothetical protein
MTRNHKTMNKAQWGTNSQMKLAQWGTGSPPVRNRFRKRGKSYLRWRRKEEGKTLSREEGFWMVGPGSVLGVVLLPAAAHIGVCCLENRVGSAAIAIQTTLSSAPPPRA